MMDNMKGVIFIVIILAVDLYLVSAKTSSLVLHLAPTVTAGQSAQYNCSSEGTGPDPTIVWSVKDSNGVEKLSNAQLNSIVVEGAADSTDGRVKSSVTFLVTSEYLSSLHRLWCGAIDSGSSVTSIQIYATIQATTTTTANLGEFCSNSVTCAIASSYCDTSSSRCKCSPGYYDNNGENVAGGSCSLQGGLGATCQAGNDLSCGALYSRCSQSSPYVCICQSGYTASGSVCVVDSAGLGESCVNPPRSCYISNSYCNGTVCICTSGYVQSGTTCVVPQAGYQDNCVSPTRTCSGNLICTGSGTCQCSSGFTYSFVSASCVTNTAFYGDSCVNPSRTCGTSNTYCANTGTCLCNTGYTYSSQSASCVSNTVLYGQACVNPSRTCVTSNSYCGNTGTCLCNIGYTYSSQTTSCVADTAEYGQSCVNPSRTCTTSNSYCANTGTCQCNNGYTYSSTTATCITASAVYGESCVNPLRVCITSNSYCANTGTCQCNGGHTYYYVSGSCVSETALYGEPCINPSRTCVTGNSVCASSGTCQCNTGYAYSSSLASCITNTANPGESCVNPSRNCVSTAFCDGSVCRCNSQYYLSSPQTCTLRRGLGESCTTTVTNSCADPNASCVGSITPVCQCNTGYTNSGGTCIVGNADQDCPPGTNVPSSVAGVSSPVSAITPTVTVGQTCYAVNLFDTQIMQCSDTKQAGSLQSARWFKLPNTQVVSTTGQFINGDIATPSLTVSSAQSSYAGSYVCQLCYGSSYTRCTNSSTITLFVRGTAITSVSVTASSTSPLKGEDVTLTCNVIPSGAAASYRWFLGNIVLGSQSQTYTLTSIQASQSGNYRCEASNVYGSTSSTAVIMDVRYLPEPFGGNTLTTVTDFSNGNVQITCNMVANPAITTYYFYDQQNNLLSTTNNKTYSVSSAQGYQTYRCKAQNSIGMSGFQNLEVVEAGGVPSTGAATEDTGLSTGAIAAIVLGIIFFLLLLLIIIICCCNYGWCRKEKVEPQVIVEKPVITQYIPSVSTEEEPRYTTPRYHLKPAINGGPIISMYDNGYNQPRAHQLPDLDTQYLYTDDEPRKLHKKKKRRHRSRRHEDDSARRQYYQPETDPEPKYAEALPASDEDLVVIPGKQNYFE